MGFPVGDGRASLRDARWKIALRLAGLHGYSLSPCRGSRPRHHAWQKHVWRAEIVLPIADGVGTNEIMRGEPGSPRPAFGAGRSAFRRTGSMDCCATRRVPRASSRWGPRTAERGRRANAGRTTRKTTHWTGYLDGEGSGAQLEFGPTHLARPRSATAPDAPVQAVQRSALRRQIARRRRGSTSIRPHTPSSGGRSTKRARFRRLTARSPDCLLKKGRGRNHDARL